MQTQSFGNVTKMKDNEQAGFGPSYSLNPKGAGYLAYLEDCHQPDVYLIRCTGFEEAFTHAEMCLCEVDEGLTSYVAQQYRELDSPDHSDSANAMFNRIDDQINRSGSSICADGSIRYTESLRLVELKAK